VTELCSKTFYQNFKQQWIFTKIYAIRDKIVEIPVKIIEFHEFHHDSCGKIYYFENAMLQTRLLQKCRAAAREPLLQ